MHATHKTKGHPPAFPVGLCFFCPEVLPAGKTAVAFRQRVLLEPLLLPPIGEVVVFGVGEVIPYVQEPDQATFAADVERIETTPYNACC